MNRAFMPLLAIEQRDPATRETAPHTHAAGQLIASLAGLLSVSTDGGSWVVPASHAIWIPPRVAHAMKSHGAFAGAMVYIAEQECANLHRMPCTFRVSSLLREAASRAASWGQPPRSEMELRVAAVIVDEIATSPPEPIGLTHPDDPRLRRITDAILAQLDDNRSLEDWAAGSGMAPRTLARRLVAETGFCFSEWRQRARTLRAIQLLVEGRSVTTTAIELGYENISAFIAMFRRITGVTPGHYARAQTLISKEAISGSNR
ncbi:MULTISPECIES: helix-turn-helix domain-containing protein [unclassified Pseudomonas]|uniref:AraC family transcriptional regulator n=1 Tax=unclassified Pseudomonas TaxID=196821 RepID=UPI000BCA7AF0|nr:MULTISPECIES: helix-turn-helix transcriptional regulator [unclassified Pseudomonas]PVZ20472.1 AraC-like DNA-binding protein [Pseudomonas sp. URIL14HWK12:I12]PVZ27538.1 AraC-like DNA-binding protein [Pseudomonas sp. URIL14HWK12:I10]PVZ38427.1 AraC-like DNA-binding protein [Pseudomonas sp. URIL14HWK12:I11]SNZ03400.1 transcriptional regulator, AraC family [Pseudomonas sp. URIL14HWK12:I9]